MPIATDGEVAAWDNYLAQAGMTRSAASDAEFQRLYGRPYGQTASTPAVTSGMQTGPQPVAKPQAIGTYGQAVQGAKENVFGQSQNVINAQAGLQPAQAKAVAASQTANRAATTAQGAVKTALGAQTASTALQEITARQNEAERLAILAASKDTSNLIDVINKRTAQKALDYRYAQEGREIPEEQVWTGEGQAPNARIWKIETNAEKLGREAIDKRALRQFNLEIAKIAAEKAGNTAEAARIDAQLETLKAQGAGIELDAAQLGLEGAKLGLDQARLNYDITKDVPEGYGVDPYSGELVTQAELDKKRAQQDVVKDPTDPTGQTLITQAELAKRTNPDGTVMDPNGIPTDTNTGNKFIDGVWTDPKTGNRFLNGIWVNTQGQQLIGARPGPNGSLAGGQWLPTDHTYEERAGEWWSDDGYILQADGSWRRTLIDGKGFFAGYAYRRWDGRQWIDWLGDREESTGGGGSAE